MTTPTKCYNRTVLLDYICRVRELGVRVAADHSTPSDQEHWLWCIEKMAETITKEAKRLSEDL